jgi:hypothetical protein
MDIPDPLNFSFTSGIVRTEGQLVEHGDLLSELKRVQKGLFGGFERELITPNTFLITGSGVLVPRHPH